jgi:methyl-accepting chemotaxis protein
LEASARRRCRHRTINFDRAWDVRAIADTMAEIAGLTTAIASAVTEQDSVSREIAGSLKEGRAA